MSAFIVGKEHIDYLVHAARHTDTRYRNHGATLDARVTDHADIIGRLLWQENVASVAYRYADSAFLDGTLSGLPGPCDFDHETLNLYACPVWAPPFNPVVALKALQCYEYQSCEHPTWRESDAFRFCEALKDTLIAYLPGYDAAPWEIEADSSIAA